MTGAGSRRYRVAFDEIATDDTSYGIAAGEYDEQFRRFARLRSLPGSEPVIAQRLTGVNPVEIECVSDSETRSVTEAWRIRDVNSGVAYNIRSIVPDEKRKRIRFICEKGVATTA